jgi:hypothetical protein
VSPTFDIIIIKDKNPVRATVNVMCRTFYLPTDRDIDIMFPATTSIFNPSINVTKFTWR